MPPLLLLLNSKSILFQINADLCIHQRILEKNSSVLNNDNNNNNNYEQQISISELVLNYKMLIGY